MKFHKIQSILIFLILVLLFPSMTKAQNISPRLSVSPHTFELDVLAGETITKTIKLTNKSEVALPILTKTVDFTASDEEGGIAFDETSQDISFSSRKWIKIENPNFILEAGETERVDFRVEVPDNAEPGGHYAILLFEPQLPSFYFEESGPTPSLPFPRLLEPEFEETPVKPRVVPVIGVLFLFSVKTFALEPEVQEKLEIVEFSIPREERLATLETLASSLLGSVVKAAAEVTITKTSPQNFILRIKNNDIYHIKPSGKILIYNIFGKEIGEAEVPRKTILPGKIRKFPVEFSLETPEKLRWLPVSLSRFLLQNFFVGHYRAELMLEAKSPLSSEILKPDAPFVLAFFSFPWKFWLPSGLFVGLVVKYRRRIQLAMKTLLSPKQKYQV